jgi:hypothetical protein
MFPPASTFTRHGSSLFWNHRQHLLHFWSPPSLALSPFPATSYGTFAIVNHAFFSNIAAGPLHFHGFFEKKSPI